MVVLADVQPERLSKNYHRQWNKTTGKFNSLMRLNEKTGPDGRIISEPSEAAMLFGVPGFVYRDLLFNALAWVCERSDKLISHHARALRAAGLVTSRRDGKMVMYSLTDAGRTLLDAVLPAGVRVST